MAWEIAKPIGGVALLGAGFWGFTKLLDKAGDAIDSSLENRAAQRRAQHGGSITERIERAGDLSGTDHVTRATVLVRAFDRDGDDRVASHEWKLQAGSDSLDGSRLFSTASYLGMDHERPSREVSIDQVVAMLEVFAHEDFSQEWNNDSPYYAQDHYEDNFQPASSEDVAEFAEGALFSRDRKGTQTRPIEIAAAEILVRYDANHDGVVSREFEHAYEAGDFTGDASRLLDLADGDGDGGVDFRELRTHLGSADDWSAQGGWENEPGPNGLLDGNDFEADGLLDL